MARAASRSRLTIYCRCISGSPEGAGCVRQRSTHADHQASWARHEGASASPKVSNAANLHILSSLLNIPGQLSRSAGGGEINHGIAFYKSKAAAQIRL